MADFPVAPPSTGGGTGGGSGGAAAGRNTGKLEADHKHHLRATTYVLTTLQLENSQSSVRTYLH